MKKVGIVTLYHKNNNYGGILQAYALNKTVRELGYACETIDYAPSPMPLKEKLTRKVKQDGILAAVTTAVRLTARNMRKKAIRKSHASVMAKIYEREANMGAFRDSRILHTAATYSNQTIAQTNEWFDIFLCGSDQIWNMGSAGSFDPVYWLEFASEDKRTASYAASMPLPKIPESEIFCIQNRVKKLNAISVREEQGRKLLEPLLGKEIPIVLDPVFLPDRSAFEELAENRVVREPYVFIYLLGDRKDTREAAADWAAKQGFKTAFIPHVLSEYRSCDKAFGDILIWDAGPAEFLSLIRHAEYVITDSFHAAAFSIIFNKEFWMFRRDSKENKRSMNTRLEYLAESFSIPNRLIAAKCLPQAAAESNKIDYAVLNEILKAEKERSIAYLRSALGEVQ